MNDSFRRKDTMTKYKISCGHRMAIKNAPLPNRFMPMGSSSFSPKKKPNILSTGSPETSESLLLWESSSGTFSGSFWLRKSKKNLLDLVGVNFRDVIVGVLICKNAVLDDKRTAINPKSKEMVVTGLQRCIVTSLNEISTA